MTHQIVTRRERELAAERWLLSAVPDPARARAEWRQQGITLIRCGALFTAVRIPVALVHAAAGTSAWREVAGFLTDALSGGPVFVHPAGGNYYALAPVSAVQHGEVDDAVCLRRETFIGAPGADRNEPDPAFGSYGVVPISRPGILCAAGDIARLVTTGQAVAATAVREAGHE